MCFYSNNCDWSEAFIKELAQTPYKHEFQFICVEKTPRAQLPNWLKQTPTLLIRDPGEEEPIKTNGDVMNWLYLRKMKDSSGPAARSSGGGGGGRSAGPQPAGSDEPEAWNISEMGGRLSESYGVLVNGSSAEVSASSSKNFDFGFLNGGAAVGDRTQQDIGNGMRPEPGRQVSKKEELLNRQLEAYQKNRDQGIPQPRMRQTASQSGNRGGGY